MATLNAPVELPASRHSLVEFPMTANVQDPTYWDALSTDGDLTRHNTRTTIMSERVAHGVTSKSRPSSRGQQSTGIQKLATTGVLPQELEAQPLSFFPPRQSSNLVVQNDKTFQEMRSDGGHTTQTSGDSTESMRSASTAGTNSFQGAQVYSISDSSAEKGNTLGSPVLSSATSTSSSAKKAAVPTSKYKKKAPPSLKSSIKQRTNADTPLASPMSSYAQILQTPTEGYFKPPLPSELPASLASPTLPTPPPEAQTRHIQLPLQHAKSTASVRKARALHSHPSIPSMRSDDLMTSPPLPQPSPNPSTTRGRKSVDTVRSRPSLYELQQPSPAPNTPLPDLPIGARSRPASRGAAGQPTLPPDVYMRPGTSSSSVAPTLRRQDTNPPAHTEMANYMTSNNKVIFRRFQDVHVRLLLTLQDEIAALEKELAEIEDSDNPIDVDRDGRRVKVLSELRKLLAEYDHLHSNWNLMQGSKADAKSRGDLEHFLKTSRIGANSTMTVGAMTDLAWLQDHSDDLSYVDLTVKKEKIIATQTEIPLEKREMKPTTKSETAPVRSTGGGGFSSFFASCTGKRK